MTPPAATVAGRALPRPVAPRGPRRVSGPARPARPGADTRTGSTRRTGRAATDPLIVRLLRRTRTLADSRLLDRLVRGRLWIPLVALGLLGIVFMQVSMLKLNAGIGRAVETASTLERQNAAMRADVSRMESGEQIDRAAHDLGMVVPADGSERYVTAGDGATAARAAQRMTAPDAQALQRTQAGQQLSAVAQAAPAASGTTTTAAPTTSATAAAVTPAQGATATTAAAPPAAAQTQAQPQAPTQTSAAPAATSPPAAATQQSVPAATAAAGGTAAPAPNGN
jgi:hypothetical protein